MNCQYLLSDITLHEDDLMDEAKDQFDFHTTILNLFELNRQVVVENDQVTDIGRHLLLSKLEKAHTTFKEVLNYIVSQNVLSKCSLPEFGPIFVCGLPRTGSTLLYNLLACDPNCRAPFTTDMSGECLPPISRSNTEEHERRKSMLAQEQQFCENLLDRQSMLAASHPSYLIEEDFLILEHAGIFIPVMRISPTCRTLVDTFYYNEIYRGAVYKYHKLFLSMLNSVDKPCSHWLVKAPEHSFSLDIILRHYTKSALIMTHRKLEDVLPSHNRSAWAFENIYFDKNDQTKKDLITMNGLRYIDKMIDHIMKFRLDRIAKDEESDKNIFDVLYDDLIKEPIATVRRIYAHFGLRWTQEFETAMYTWLRDNPQGKQGRHTYNLSDIGLTREDIGSRYAPYIHLFLRS
ncbi:unnamed protein product [Adineta ricciae]|uniref:Sulfotransferase n=1 Tax=Adineta ricciae TaxID=249248 RepID=A0A815VWC1_ADIRI|nr:unnamed protein product [Adineta ricciae]